MRRAVQFSTFATALAVSVSCATSVAAPAGGWESPPTTLAPYTLGTWDPSVTLDRDGDALALWTSAPEDEAPGQQNVYAAAHPAGVTWEPRTLVWPGAYAVEPTLAGNSAGDAVAAWIGGASDFAEIVHVAERDGATGAWGGIADFAAADTAQSRPRVALNDRGDALVTWIEADTSGEPYVRAAARTAGGWSAPVTLSDRGDYSVFSRSPAAIALDDSGNAVVMWIARHNSDSTFHVQESRFDGGAWGPARNVASSTDWIVNLELSGDGHGGAAAAWFLGGDPLVVQAGVLSNGDWTVTDVSSDVASTCAQPGAVSAAGNGRATVAWQRESTGDLVTATGTAGAWGPVATLYAPPAETAVEAITLRQTAGREPVAAWTTANYDDMVFGAMGSRRDATGWLAPTLLTTAGGRSFSRPSVAMAPSGTALAAWAVYQSYWAKVQVAWAPVAPPPAPAPPAPPTQRADTPARGLDVLNPPFVRVRGGLLRLPRVGRTVSARLVNRADVPLRGTARLVHFQGRPAKDGSPMRTIALQRKVRVGVERRSVLRLRLSAAAIDRLRASRRHSYPARLYLRLRAPDGRTVRTTTTFTLDGWKRFGGGPRPPVARKSC